MMRLQLSVPTHIVIDADVSRVLAEGEQGSFCIKPRHVDYLVALVPSLLSVMDEAGQERLFAIDEGLLIKQGRRLMISTRRAIPGDSLGQLQAAVRSEFEALDDRERAYQAALASLEAGFVRGFLRLEQGSLG